MERKMCPRCRKKKPLTEEYFYRCRTAYCRPCTRAYSKEYYKKHKKTRNTKRAAAILQHAHVLRQYVVSQKRRMRCAVCGMRPKDIKELCLPPPKGGKSIHELLYSTATKREDVDRFITQSTPICLDCHSHKFTRESAQNSRA